MVRQDKIDTVKNLEESFKSTAGVVLTEYQGLTVEQITDLRAKLRSVDCEYKVVKNTLATIALKNMGFEDFSKNFTGPTAIALQNGDVAGSAKVLLDFSKENAKLKLMAGLLDGKVLSSDQVKHMAALPPRDVLVAMLLGTMQAPIRNLAGVMQGTIRQVVTALDAVRKQKEEQK